MPEWSEVLVILVVAMMVFGPHRLPEMARKAGKMMAEFRVAARELREGIEKELALEDMREAAQDVLTPTKEAAQELRKSLAESDRALRSAPPLAHPTDTTPGTERLEGQEPPDSEETDTAEAEKPHQTADSPSSSPAEIRTEAGPASPDDFPTGTPDKETRQNPKPSSEPGK